MKSVQLRFGVGTLLLLTSCVAGYLSGNKLGSEERKERLAAKLSMRSYNVSDLISRDTAVSASAQLESMCSLIIKSVGKGTWDDKGINITPFAANSTIVVTQRAKEHDEILDFFTTMRQLNATQKNAVGN